MKRYIPMLAGGLANAVLGFWYFALAFNGYKIPIAGELAFISGVPLAIGVISGLLTRKVVVQDHLVSLFPLIGFLGLFVMGAVEKGTSLDVAIASGRFLVPIVIQLGSCALVSRIASSRKASESKVA